MTGWWRGLDGRYRTATGTVAVVAVMASLGWAAVPLYDLFCRVTGFGGTTQVGTGPSDLILDRTITVRFDASRERGFPWEFRPVERSHTLRIGETGIAFYEAYNPTDRPIAGTASYNVTPYSTGSYFIKIACFCFTEQTLAAGESMDMPVVFFLDPDLEKDERMRGVADVTLSYTFFAAKTQPKAGAAQLQPAASPQAK